MYLFGIIRIGMKLLSNTIGSFLPFISGRLVARDFPGNRTYEKRLAFYIMGVYLLQKNAMENQE